MDRGDESRLVAGVAAPHREVPGDESRGAQRPLRDADDSRDRLGSGRLRAEEDRLDTGAIEQALEQAHA